MLMSTGKKNNIFSNFLSLSHFKISVKKLKTTKWLPSEVKKIKPCSNKKKCFFNGRQNLIDSVKRTRFSPNIKDTSFICVFDVALSFRTLLRKKFFERQWLLLFVYCFLAFVSFVEDKKFFENFNFNILHIK